VERREAANKFAKAQKMIPVVMTESMTADADGFCSWVIITIKKERMPLELGR
jgi:hypothetical protein